eukprot:TRINITY_DN56847_c0_g1_i1.p1 TRINITY_DN56847_c0_g1~~TRINITY_DN56847_c0_g1_i1.p1  ORF type:complete len:301 (+),score=82.19 TRINITY_DN56847_c0_g1_i1:162-1064(+)
MAAAVATAEASPAAVALDRLRESLVGFRQDLINYGALRESSRKRRLALEELLGLVAASSGQARAAPPAASAKPRQRLRHVFFDFDQTISRVHVFKLLAGWEPGVPAPHACSERGQISRVSELNGNACWHYDANFSRVIRYPPGASGGVRWSAAVLGGPERVEELRACFGALQSAGAKLTILTQGNVGCVRYLLEQEGMLKHFRGVIGRVSTHYGETDYDVRNRHESPFEAAEDDELWDSKGGVISCFMQEEGLLQQEVAFVEDDKEELRGAAGLCRHVYVSERRGMTSAHMEQLREWAQL